MKVADKDHDNMLKEYEHIFKMLESVFPLIHAQHFISYNNQSHSF